MSSELIELIGACVIALLQIYTLQGYDFPVLAWVWDLLAKITGRLANALGFASMHARANYYAVVNSYGA